MTILAYLRRAYRRGRYAASRARVGRPRRLRETGFAYLMALFLVLAMVIASQVAVQNALTLGRRDKEKDMLWRGNQYIRAIRLYYRKTGHYPQTLDDLEKGLPELHFLRAAAYKDPMNQEDGSWRFIYVNGSGQIIGSVRYATLQQMAYLDVNGCQPPPPVEETSTGGSSSGSSSFGAGSNASSGFSGFNSSTNATSAMGALGSGATGAMGIGGGIGGASTGTGVNGTANGTTPQANPCGTPNPNQSSNGNGSQNGSQNSSQSESSSDSASQNSSGTSSSTSTDTSTDQSGNSSSNASSSAGTSTSGSSGAGAAGGSSTSSASSGSFAPGLIPNPLLLLKPTGPVDEPVVGGFLTGVGSKVDRSSIRVFKGGKKYIDWEFIWNPLEDQARAMQAGISGATQAGQLGQPGIGQSMFGGMAGAAGAAGAAIGMGSNPNTTGGAPATPPSEQPQTQTNSNSNSNSSPE
jgi:hypothetical protein